MQLSSCQKTRFAFYGQSEKLRKHSISEIVGLSGKSRPVLRRPLGVSLAMLKNGLNTSLLMELLITNDI